MTNPQKHISIHLALVDMAIIDTLQDSLTQLQAPEQWQERALACANIAELEQALRERCGWHLNQRLAPGQLVINPSLSYTDVYEVLAKSAYSSRYILCHTVTQDHIAAAPDDQYLIIGTVKGGGSHD